MFICFYVYQFSSVLKPNRGWLVSLQFLNQKMIFINKFFFICFETCTRHLFCNFLTKKERKRNLDVFDSSIQPNDFWCIVWWRPKKLFSKLFFLSKREKQINKFFWRHFCVINDDRNWFLKLQMNTWF